MNAIKTIQWAYDTLGITSGATVNEAKQAYRELVMVWHPDRFQNDTRLQLRALEMVKNINEAYELVRAELATGANCHDRCYVGASPAATAQHHGFPNSPCSDNADQAPHQPHSSQGFRLIDVNALWRFNAWQNLIFVIFIVIVLYSSTAQFGSLLSGAGYALEMLALPTIFAIACNVSQLRSNKSTWAAYVTIVCVSAVIVVIDSISYRNEVKEASSYSSAPSSNTTGSTGVYRGALPGSYPGEPLSIRASRVPAGPAPPRSPYVEAPSAPVVPDAPSAPVAPMAAPAR